MSQIATSGLGRLLEGLYKQHNKRRQSLILAVEERAIDVIQKRITKVHKEKQAPERRKKGTAAAKVRKRKRKDKLGIPKQDFEDIKDFLKSHAPKDLQRIIRGARKNPGNTLDNISHQNLKLFGIILCARGEAAEQINAEMFEVKGKTCLVDDPYQRARFLVWKELEVQRDEDFADDGGHRFDDYMGRRVAGADDPADDEIHAVIVRLNQGPFPRRLVSDLLDYCRNGFEPEEWGLNAFSSVPQEGNQAQSDTPTSVPGDLVSISVALTRFNVSRATIDRDRLAGRIHGFRLPNAKSNSAFSYSEAELGRRYTRHSA